jgi:DNA-binding transcriptional regulator YhcF (GntR family)
MDLREIASAYQSIYLNEEVEEELILEDLSQEEIDSLVEEIYDEFLEEGFSLEEIDRGFENYISEESEVLNEERAAKKC